MPRITEADLKKQIKNKSFSPVYLIYGSEQMFVKSYTKKLCEAVAGKNPSDFNYHTFSGDIDFQELASIPANNAVYGGTQLCLLLTRHLL